MDPPRKIMRTDWESIDDESIDEICGVDSLSEPFLASQCDSNSSFDSDIDLPLPEIREETSKDSDCDSAEFSSDDEFEGLESETDPYNCINEKLFDLVQQHLTGNEMKSACCVSRKWFRDIFRSQLFMSKVTLKIEIEEPGTPDNLSALLKSHRKYENVHINIRNDKEIQKKVDAIIRKFSSSIRNLKITKFGGFNSMLNKPLSLFKLESLELRVVCGRLFGDFLQSVSTLKKLSVDGLDPSGLQLCLEQNPDLEELEIYENSFISYFERDMSAALPFELKKLSVFDHMSTKMYLDGEFPAEQWNGSARINFIKFLKSQASSLQSLHLDVCHAEDLNRIITALPTLNCLEVSQLIGDPAKLKLADNNKITTFIAMKINDQLLHAVIANMKNLKSMFINNLKTHQFIYIARNADQLENFCYFWASATEKIHGNFIDLEMLHSRVCQTDDSMNVNSINIQRMKREKYLETVREM